MNEKRAEVNFAEWQRQMYRRTPEETELPLIERLTTERDRYREALEEIRRTAGDSSRGQLLLIARQALDA